MKINFVEFINISFAELDMESAQKTKLNEAGKNTADFRKESFYENEWQMEYDIIYNSYKLESLLEFENAGW